MEKREAGKQQFVIASTAVTDEIRFADGKHVKKVAGGAGIYALCGARLWEDEVLLVTGVGADYQELYGEWYRSNGLSMDGLIVKTDKTPHNIIQYFPDGERTETPLYGQEHYDRVVLPAEALKPYFSTAKGIYIFRNSQPDYWNTILQYKENSSATVMWEIASDAAYEENKEAVKSIARKLEILSINQTEASRLLGTTDLLDMIREFQTWGLPLVFLRRGSKGAVMITPAQVTEVPCAKGITVVDPTGGGNSSSGAVLCGFCRGRSLEECAWMGNLAAAMCLGQYGVPPRIGEAQRTAAEKQLTWETKPLQSKKMRQKPSIQKIHRDYGYYRNVPERGLMIQGRPAMTQIDPEKVGDFVLITVRDPLCRYDMDPAKQIADRLEDAELIGSNGMFTTYSGYYKGAKITVVSGGSGSPEAELVLYDFMEYTDAGTFLRVGGSGGIGDQVKPGDVVIASGVVREEGMTKAYVPAAYPAASHYEVISAMVQAAEEAGTAYHVGVTLSVDSDFVGGGRPGVGGYLQPWNIDIAEVYNRAGILNGDRESAAIVTLSALFGRRGGSVCSVADNLCTGEKFVEGGGHNKAIDIALEGCAILNQMDEAKKTAGKKNWYPELGCSGK